jgi:Domain of unknown function (DUF4442)
MASTLELWHKVSALPAGKWTFTRMLCLKAPYFSSISPLFEELKPNSCKISIRKKRSVLNHIGTVHAIAMCNMAELAGGYHDRGDGSCDTPLDSQRNDG